MQVSTFQMTILMLFNNREKYTFEVSGVGFLPDSNCFWHFLVLFEDQVPLILFEYESGQETQKADH